LSYVPTATLSHYTKRPRKGNRISAGVPRGDPRAMRRGEGRGMDARMPVYLGIPGHGRFRLPRGIIGGADSVRGRADRARGPCGPVRRGRKAPRVERWGTASRTEGRRGDWPNCTMPCGG